MMTTTPPRTTRPTGALISSVTDVAAASIGVRLLQREQAPQAAVAAREVDRDDTVRQEVDCRPVDGGEVLLAAVVTAAVGGHR
jgi:hypothetical protein